MKHYLQGHSHPIIETNGMFCYQCQETAFGKGCSLTGVCGKTPEVAHAQDLLVYIVKAIGLAADRMKCSNTVCAKEQKQIQRFVTDALFSTITNANFDLESITKRIDKALMIRNKLVVQCRLQGIDLPHHDSLIWDGTRDQYDAKAKTVGVLSNEDEDICSLQELTLYGLKGMAAYLEHAARLGQCDCDIDNFLLHALGLLVTCQEADVLTTLVITTGQWGIRAMALLDKANTMSYGNPEMTRVSTGVGTRPGILVSGHDLNDLEQLLEQSINSGIDIYTHCEMLPAHYYPRLKIYHHLRGNYGNSWWKQREEMDFFNGPILFTSNCIVPPTKHHNYSQRAFTTNSTDLPGWRHIRADEHGRKDFSEIIALAQTCPPPREIETGSIVGGFAHHQMLALTDKIVEAIRSGVVSKLVVMAGCDGRMGSREYYSLFAQALPQDCIILTAGCAKFRYNKLPLGNIAGLPRVLDAGQCNDCYSLVMVASKLKEVLELDDINNLPIAYNIAWYEQKAVIVLLALLSLGIKNIRLGPTLPAFLSPGVRKLLAGKYGLTCITTAQEDMCAMEVAAKCKC